MSAADDVFDFVDAVLPERAKALLFIGFVLIVAKIAPHAYQHAWAWYAHHESRPYLDVIKHLQTATPTPAAH